MIGEIHIKKSEEIMGDHCVTEGCTNDVKNAINISEELFKKESTNGYDAIWGMSLEKVRSNIGAYYILYVEHKNKKRYGTRLYFEDFKYSFELNRTVININDIESCVNAWLEHWQAVTKEKK